MNFMRLALTLFFAITVYCSTAFSGYADDNENTGNYENQSTGIEDEVEEGLRTVVASIDRDLKSITPRRIVEFYNKLKIPENPLDRATIYYSEQYEILAEALRKLDRKKGTFAQYNEFFLNIDRLLKSERDSCFDNTVSEEFRLDCLGGFHSGLLGSTMALRKIFKGMTLEDLYSEAVALNESSDVTVEQEPEIEVAVEDDSVISVEDGPSVSFEKQPEVSEEMNYVALVNTL